MISFVSRYLVSVCVLLFLSALPAQAYLSVNLINNADQELVDALIVTEREGSGERRDVRTRTCIMPGEQYRTGVSGPIIATRMLLDLVTDQYYFPDLSAFNDRMENLNVIVAFDEEQQRPYLELSEKRDPPLRVMGELIRIVPDDIAMSGVYFTQLAPAAVMGDVRKIVEGSVEVENGQAYEPLSSPVDDKLLFPMSWADFTFPGYAQAEEPGDGAAVVACGMKLPLDADMALAAFESYTQDSMRPVYIDLRKRGQGLEDESLALRGEDSAEATAKAREFLQTRWGSEGVREMDVFLLSRDAFPHLLADEAAPNPVPMIIMRWTLGSLEMILVKDGLDIARSIMEQ